MPKKNLRKIPPNIFNKLKSIDSQYIVVGILKTFTKDYIVEGNLEHLDIYIDDENLQFNKLNPFINKDEIIYHSAFKFGEIYLHIEYNWNCKQAIIF